MYFSLKHFLISATISIQVASEPFSLFYGLRVFKFISWHISPAFGAKSLLIGFQSVLTATHFAFGMNLSIFLSF